MSDPQLMPAHVRTITLVLLATAMVAATFMIIRPAPPVAPVMEAKLAAAPVRQEGRMVAITLDDLPALAQGDRSIATYERITDGLLRALAEHRVPAIGFVNEEKLLTEGRVDPRRVATLRRWVDAGLELGNHAYSHPDFHTTPVDAYIADVARGDSVTRLVMQAAGRRPRFFRHPFLHSGRTLEDRRKFEAFLAERGYRVAPVTIDNGDYLFAAAYDLAPDAETRRRVADEYIRYMEAVAAYYEQQSTALFGREIRQVLLLHANNLNAEHFGRLAEMYRRRGYAFVPLEQALEDPAYASADTSPAPRASPGCTAGRSPKASAAPFSPASPRCRTGCRRCRGGRRTDKEVHDDERGSSHPLRSRDPLRQTGRAGNAPQRGVPAVTGGCGLDG